MGHVNVCRGHRGDEASIANVNVHEHGVTVYRRWLVIKFMRWWQSAVVLKCMRAGEHVEAECGLLQAGVRCKFRHYICIYLNSCTVIQGPVPQGATCLPALILAQHRQSDHTVDCVRYRRDYDRALRQTPAVGVARGALCGCYGALHV